MRTPEMAGMCGVDLFGVCNGLWPDGTAPMGPRDASEGMPTVACATCGQNRNPRSFASVDFDMPIEPQRQAVEHSEVAATKDVELELEIPLEATLQRREEIIPLQRFATCSRCQGVGAEPGSRVKECFSCRGTGQVQRIQRTIFGSFTRGGICP